MKESFLTSRQKLILFLCVGVFCIAALVAFFFPTEKGARDTNEVKQAQESVVPSSTVAPSLEEVTPLASVSPASKTLSNSGKDYRYLFIDPPRQPGYSNAVGYIGYTFVLYLPDWLSSGKWRSSSEKESTREYAVNLFSPMEDIQDRDFSDIRVESRVSSEIYNAEYLYNIKKKQLQEGPKAEESYTFEFFYSEKGNLLIYHIQKRTISNIDDTYYLNSGGRTAKITFSAAGSNKEFYSQKVLEFMMGFVNENTPQG